MTTIQSSPKLQRYHRHHRTATNNNLYENDAAAATDISSMTSEFVEVTIHEDAAVPTVPSCVEDRFLVSEDDLDEGDEVVGDDDDDDVDDELVDVLLDDVGDVKVVRDEGGGSGGGKLIPPNVGKMMLEFLTPKKQSTSSGSATKRPTRSASAERVRCCALLKLIHKSLS